MDIAQNTLYLTTPGTYVARDHLTLQVEVPEYPPDLPPEERNPKLILLKNPADYFFRFSVAASGASRRQRKSDRASNCHWTGSPAVKSSAAAKGNGRLT